MKYFPNTMHSPGEYWSSIPFLTNTLGRWGITFRTGSDLTMPVNHRHDVRAVRGGYSKNTFIDNGNGTVTDKSTGLMWQQETTTEMTWKSALSYCENLSLGGYSDWRLPNIKELASIVDLSRERPSIYTVFFPNANSSSGSYYWSSTTHASYISMSRLVTLFDGTDGRQEKWESYYVRAVRGGQKGKANKAPIIDSFKPNPDPAWRPDTGYITDEELRGGV